MPGSIGFGRITARRATERTCEGSPSRVAFHSSNYPGCWGTRRDLVPADTGETIAMRLGWIAHKRPMPAPVAGGPRALVEIMESRVLFTAMVSGVIYDSPVPPVEASLQTTV